MYSAACVCLSRNSSILGTGSTRIPLIFRDLCPAFRGVLARDSRSNTNQHSAGIRHKRAPLKPLQNRPHRTRLPPPHPPTHSASSDSTRPIEPPHHTTTTRTAATREPRAAAVIPRLRPAYDDQLRYSSGYSVRPSTKLVRPPARVSLPAATTRRTVTRFPASANRRPAWSSATITVRV